jgi:ribosomal protein S18 acetylase RimI-like enzyme
MAGIFINLAEENLQNEHLCCAISDKKHQSGVDCKRAWLTERISEGHVFRKLDAQGKVFIEYGPLETAWVSVEGKNYIYIYCLWVSGSFKDKGYGRELIQYCIDDAKGKNRSGVCIISSKKKKPFISDKKFIQKFGFEVVDTIGQDYELLGLSFDGTKPAFGQNAKTLQIDNQDLTIYYSVQCPYIPDCIEQISNYCKTSGIPVKLIKINSCGEARKLPCIFNNWAVFIKGKFVTHHLLNEGYLKKTLGL